MLPSALIGFLLSATVALAFPANGVNSQRRQAGPSNPPQGQGALPLVPPPFNADVQRISTSGAHRFIPPGPTDARGECPGLNSLANHGYIPRNGIATIDQFINATDYVFGMGVDISTFLAVYGALVDGPLTSFSIGGLPHTGILGSHNNYETDSSAYKSDLNQYGTNVELVLDQFKQLYDSQPNAATANYNIEVFRQYRKSRFLDSVSDNPYFVYTPFAGIQVGSAGYAFQYRLMGNHSAEYPEGILNQEVLKSFMSVSGPNNNLKHTIGHERIPDNWYRRNPVDMYTIPYLQSDILYFAEAEPAILTVGCNQGTGNSYDTIDIATLTGGAYTAQQVQQNPACFSLQYAIAQLPVLTGLSATALAPFLTLLNQATAGLDCPAITNLNTTALAACPGFTLFGGPTGPIAPGARPD